MFVPKARYETPWSGQLIVLAPGNIPTTDYYVSTRVNGLPAEQGYRFDSTRAGGWPAKLPAGAFVVIVRYASRAWLDYLRRQEGLSGVAFLADDDLAGAWRCRDVPRLYGVRTSWRFVSTRRQLGELCDRVWVSTRVLADRYPRVPTTVVPPLAFECASAVAPAGCRRWGYHGTWIHGREIRWLVPIVAAVHEALPDAEFELFGDRRVVRMFHDIPRVRVLRKRYWPEYLAYARSASLAVSLAPLLPGRFNAARAHTKLFDIIRCGAVGLFSSRPPYSTALADSGAVLLDDDPSVWIAQVSRWLDDDALRLAGFARLTDWVSMHCGDGDIARLIAERRADR